MRSRFVTGCSYCSARSPAWRFAEFAALRRRDIDLKGGELRVHRSQAELKRVRTIIKDPKSEAGRRFVAIPAVALADLQDHLNRFAEPGPNGLVFVGPKGGPLRRRNFHAAAHRCQHQGTDDPDGTLHPGRSCL